MFNYDMIVVINNGISLGTQNTTVPKKKKSMEI